MAERRLAAATADVGVAVADLYPRFRLTGAAQLISTTLGNLFTGDSLQLTGQAQAMFPILDWGKRKGQVAQRKAQADEAYFAYQKIVLGALRDVEDALIRIRSEQERNHALQEGLADALRSVKVVEARHASGLVDYGAVLDARAQAISSRDQVILSDGALRRNMLALTKALGGGWEGLPLPSSVPNH
jgi:outer membrane protein TolC